MNSPQGTAFRTHRQSSDKIRGRSTVLIALAFMATSVTLGCVPAASTASEGVRVFIASDAASAEVDQIIEFVGSQEGVERVVYVSADDQYAAVLESSEESPEIISTLTEDSFPAMIDVEFDGRGADDVDTLIEALEAWPRYDAVVDSIERVPAE